MYGYGYDYYYYHFYYSCVYLRKWSLLTYFKNSGPSAF